MHREAPANLLVEPDILHQLGFALSQRDETNLLSKDADNNATSDHKNPRLESGHAIVESIGNDMNDPSSSTRATVKLIQASRLPAKHLKLIRAGVMGPGVEGDVCLFEPVLESLHTKGSPWLSKSSELVMVEV